KMNIQIRSLCGGKGSCGKCKILVQKGYNYFDPTEKEKKLLSPEELEKGWRLSCQTVINEKFFNKLKRIEPPQFRIFLPEELLLEDFNILTSGVNKGVEFNPAIKKLYIEVEKPSLEKPIPDLERIETSILKVNKDLNRIESQIYFNFDLLNLIPNILRESDHKITLTFWNNNEIIAFESGNTVKENFGIAFDIGTTTIVGYLINLNNGMIYSIVSKLNPQTAFGEDVITRITYIKDNKDGLEKLNSLVVEALNDIILKNCARVKIKPSQIYEATIVGNSVMHHIFLGLNPVNIALSPYIPIIQHGLNVKSKKLKLNISSQGNIYILPIIAGFVGADTMGVILSSHIEEEKDLTLAIDIGTNGEIILGNKKILATGSCAAGSALEGAHIKDGMRAAAGAIDRIKIDPKDFSVSYTTIKNKKPIGICGSGLIDAVAEMLKSKIITRSGNFNKEFTDHERIIKNDNNIEFIIATKEETNINKNITLSQRDIREIQMAKAAFYAGMKIILNTLNIKTEIKQIFLAGAFGTYINKENAKFIGMIPDIPSEKIFQIGNAAGIGAQNCLLNKEQRKKAEILLKKIKYIEIAIRKEFQKEYAEAMYFPHLNLKNFPNLKEYSNISKR
ncbi:MAG: ASKHA domain-containing protein, partial [Promethearchaeota archaeon]